MSKPMSTAEPELVEPKPKRVRTKSPYLVECREVGAATLTEGKQPWHAAIGDLNGTFADTGAAQKAIRNHIAGGSKDGKLEYRVVRVTWQGVPRIEQKTVVKL
jgi:hypothetical protein